MQIRFAFVDEKQVLIKFDYPYYNNVLSSSTIPSHLIFTIQLKIFRSIEHTCFDPQN